MNTFKTQKTKKNIKKTKKQEISFEECFCKLQPSAINKNICTKQSNVLKKNDNYTQTENNIKIITEKHKN